MITIKGSNQEVFNRSVKRLAQQDWQRCVADDGTCAYRRDGRACAVGALIDDSAYDPAIEEVGVEELITTGRLALDGCDEALLTDMQSAHDLLDFDELDAVGVAAEMRKLLRKIARQFDLTIPTELQEAAQ